MKKWIINYILPEDVKPDGSAASRSWEGHASADHTFGKVEEKFLKKYPTATIETMRRLRGDVEEL